MEKPEITILLPGIRKQRWDAMYDSICKSTRRSFELIICGPYGLTDKLQELRNVKYVKDFGSPVRASNIAASLTEGKYVTWIADDANLIPDALDHNINLLEVMGNDVKNVVVAKYYEGRDGTHKPLQPDNYFKVGGSPWSHSKFVPADFWLFNVAIMHTEFFNELGGWDCSYQGTWYSHTDMAIRAQSYGANVVMSNHPLLDCDHSQDDHPPIEDAQTNYDKPHYFSVYGNPGWMHKDKCIDMDNWKNVSPVWKRRFG